jgi:hypothetical protein
VADQKEFKRQKARLRDAILHDRRLTRAERRIGYEIADCLNYRTGDAWPSQAYLAQRSGYSVKTVERATKRLARTGDHDCLWFRREIDGKGYRYIPKFDQLAQAETRQNVGSRFPTFMTGNLEFGDRHTRQKVRLTSLGDPKRELDGTGGQVTHLTLAQSHTDKRDDESPIDCRDLDQTITAAAAGGGAPRFVFKDSEPWRAWEDYRKRNGISGPLPSRQHMVGGRWRTGWDVPTLWPPGYGRVRPKSGR